MRNFCKNKIILTSVLSLISGLGILILTACDKDNTPPPKPLIPLDLDQSGQKGVKNNNFKVQEMFNKTLTDGSAKKYVTLGPVLDVSAGKLITADYRGEVVALDLNSHKVLWDVKTHEELGGMPGVFNNHVYLGTLDGKLLALDESNGKIAWQQKLTSALWASPVGNSDLVLAYTHDGNLTAFSSLDGRQVWQYLGDTLPSLIMAGESNPVIVGTSIIIGTHSGQLVSIDLTKGDVNWQRPIAIPAGGTDVSQMVDVVGNLVVDNQGDGVLYAVTYHGNVVAVDPADGSLLWESPLSSLKALALSPSAVIATNDQGDVLAFDRDTGRELWNQKAFEYRFVTAPAVLDLGANQAGLSQVAVVADYQGYVHFLDLKNGQEIARNEASSHIIAAAPVVLGKNIYLDRKSVV